MILRGTAWGIRAWRTGSSAQVPSGWNPRLQCHPRQQFYWDLGLLPSSILADRIQFPLQLVDWIFLLAFAGDLPEIWQAILTPHAVPPWAICNTVDFFLARGGSLLFLLSLTSKSLLKGVFCQTHPDNLSSDWLQVNWSGDFGYISKSLHLCQMPLTNHRVTPHRTPWITHIQRVEIIQCGHTRGRSSGAPESCPPQHLMKTLS